MQGDKLDSFPNFRLSPSERLHLERSVKMESTETEPLIESAVSSHANRGGNATNWWSYESLTIGEAAALHHGMPPELAFSPRWAHYSEP